MRDNKLGGEKNQKGKNSLSFFSPLDKYQKPPPLSSPLESIPERLAEAPPAVTVNVWPNDGQVAEGNANAEAAFGHLAVSTVNEREPIRMSHGGASDFDANEGRVNEGERESGVFILLEGGREGLEFLGRGRKREELEVCSEREGVESFWERVERAKGLARSTGASCDSGLCALTSSLCSFLRQGSRLSRS